MDYCRSDQNKIKGAIQIMSFKNIANLLPPIVVRISRILGIRAPWSVRSAISLDKLSNSDEHFKVTIPVENSGRVVFENVVVDLKSGYCFDTEFSVIKETSNWPILELTKRTIPRPISTPLTYDVEKIATVLPSNGFYHWLIEDLPGVIEILEDKDFTRVLIYQNAPKFIFDFLKSFQIEFEKYPRFSKFERLTMPIRKDNIGAPSIYDIALLRNFFMPKLSRQGVKHDVYISRINSSRSPSFERELQSQLIAKGWKIAYLEEMDLITQFNVFQNAKSILGVHGAGLSGFIFSDVEAPIFELYPSDRDIKCFENIAKATGHNLTRIPFESEAKEVPANLISMINLM